MVDPTGLFNLVVLRKGSYFGEYPVLHQMGTNFTFVTGKSKDVQDKSSKKKHGHWFYSIEADKFMSICDGYPTFQRYLRVRTSLRRAYWMRIME